jgi:hypothetical protein
MIFHIRPCRIHHNCFLPPLPFLARGLRPLRDSCTGFLCVEYHKVSSRPRNAALHYAKAHESVTELVLTVILVA